MLTSETKRRIDACRDVLVGKLPLPTDQVELITLALIYKFMDDLDEESVRMGGKRSFFTGELGKYRWRALMPQTLSAEQRMNLFAEGIETLAGSRRPGGKDLAAHLPGLFRDIFRNAFLKFRDGRILTLFLTELNGFAYSHSEELGNAFEYLLQCMGTQGENGQFRTPRHIIDFMVACLDPRPGDTILDPACGTGGFLVSAYKHILAKSTSPGSSLPGDRLSHAQRQQLYAGLAGYDITDLMVKLSKVNLFLHGFPDPAIHIYDTLSNDARWHEKADLILANPPFMTPKGGVTPHAKFRIAAKKAEVLFTDYIAEHLTPDGRGGVIVPNGIVATTQNAYVKLRRFLVEDSLVAVVSLPAGVFKPYSGVKTSILLLGKKLARQTKEILFLKIGADGFDLGDKRTPINANDLPEAERVVKLWLAGKLNDKVETPLVWKAVEKPELESHRTVGLQAEQQFGEAPENSSNFEMVRLGDVCETTSGGTPARAKSEYYEGGTIPWVKSGEVAQGYVRATEEKITELGLQNSSAKLFPVNTVLVALYGATTGEVGLLKIPAATNQAVCGVLPNGRFIPEFLFFTLRSLKEEMKQRSGGGAQQNISQEIIRDLEVPLPPLEEQRRLVAEIEGYQKVLDGARQILAGYRPRFQTDPDCPLVAVRDITSLSSGGTPPKSNPEYWTGTIPWVSAKDMKSPQLSDAQLHVSESAIKETAAELAPKGSVLVLVRGMGLANGVPICELVAPCAFNQDVKALRPTKDVSSAYLAASLRQEELQFKRAISTAAHGTLKIETDRLLEIQIPLPPLPEQRRIVAELDAEATQIESVRALIPRFEAKIQRVLDRVWGNSTEAPA